MSTLLLAIVGHLVGDYLLQNDWMALNKKKPAPRYAIHCAIHSAIWTLTVCCFASWWNWGVLLTLFFAHYWQDRTNVVMRWMKLIGQGKFATGPCAPWSIIVVDNVWHIVSLYVVARFLA